jgi:hypothetical protein
VVQGTFKIWSERNVNVNNLDGNKLANLRRWIIKNNKISNEEIHTIEEEVRADIEHRNDNVIANDSEINNTGQVTNERELVPEQQDNSNEEEIFNYEEDIENLSQEAEELYTNFKTEIEKNKFQNFSERKNLQKIDLSSYSHKIIKNANDALGKLLKEMYESEEYKNGNNLTIKLVTRKYTQ